MPAKRGMLHNFLEKLRESGVSEIRNFKSRRAAKAIQRC